MGLYISAGIPIIVWSKSGQRAFVEKYKCGITIDKLDDLPKAINIAESRVSSLCITSLPL